LISASNTHPIANSAHTHYFARLTTRYWYPEEWIFKPIQRYPADLLKLSVNKFKNDLQYFLQGKLCFSTMQVFYNCERDSERLCFKNATSFSTTVTNNQSKKNCEFSLLQFFLQL
jgi:hypothetical protein